jgi:two-component system sensor histidine kinase KdpD
MDTGELRAVMKALDIMLDTSISFDKKLGRMLKFITKNLKSRNGSIMILENDHLVIRASMKPELIGQKQSMSDDSISIRVFNQSKALKIDDLRKKPELSNLMRRPEMNKSPMFISAPIMAQTGPVGIFNISDKTSEDHYSKEETDTLFKWILRISPIVESAKLTHDLQTGEKKLKKANRMLKKLEDLKRDLVNMIVHDMKNPLSEVSANLALLEDEKLEELGKMYLESAVIGTQTLLRMIRNVLDISRMEEDQLKLSLEPIEVSGFLREMVDKNRSVFELNELSTEIEISGEQKELMADRSLIERVLANLFSNAMEHSPIKGEVVIAAAFHQTRPVVEIRVSDQGKGIPKQDLENVFKKFYQLGERKARGGSGLGLSFCDMAIRAHKGKIWAESEVGSGSVFVFELPLVGAS